MHRVGYCLYVLIKNGVYLCDLKPDNIVLKPNYSGISVLYDMFIIDFGGAYVKGLTKTPYPRALTVIIKLYYIY